MICTMFFKPDYNRTCRNTGTREHAKNSRQSPSHCSSPCSPAFAVTARTLDVSLKLTNGRPTRESKCVISSAASLVFAKSRKFVRNPMRHLHDPPAVLHSRVRVHLQCITPGPALAGSGSTGARGGRGHDSRQIDRRNQRRSEREKERVHNQRDRRLNTPKPTSHT